MARIRNKTELKPLVKALKSEKDFNLIQDVYYRCWIKGEDPQEYWNEVPATNFMMLNKDIQRMLTDEGRDAFYNIFKKEKNEEEGERGFKTVPYSEFLHKHLSSRIRASSNRSLGFQYYEVVDLENKVVREISNSADDFIRRAIEQTIIKDKVIPVIYKAGEAVRVQPDTILYDFKYKEEHLTLPSPMAKHDEDIWSFHRCIYEPCKIDTPFFDSVVARVSEPEAFKAWLWAAYDGGYQGRQMLWVHGPNGQEGKSTFFIIWSKLVFGPSMYSMSNSQLTAANKQFFTSYIYDKRFVLYPDANNTYLLMDELGKSLVSGDPVPIEKKQKHAVSRVLDCRLAVLSNREPFILKAGWCMSRIILCDIEPIKGSPIPFGEIKRTLDREMPGIFWKCREAYQRLCPDNTAIRTSQEHNDRLAELSDAADRGWDVIFNPLFETVDSDEYISYQEMKDLIDEQARLRKSEFNEFLTYMKREYKVIIRRVQEVGIREHRVYGIKIRDTL